MILRGLTVTGPRAYEMGIVHEVVADPLARALEIGAELSSRGAEGLALGQTPHPGCPRPSSGRRLGRRA
jgi:enoyl-CoA hydratase/carnithine racemase